MLRHLRLNLISATLHWILADVLVQKYIEIDTCEILTTKGISTDLFPE